MALPLLAILLGGYIFIGMFAGEFTWRVRIILIGLSFGAPAWFYFFL